MDFLALAPSGSHLENLYTPPVLFAVCEFGSDGFGLYCLVWIIHLQEV